jgi:hypothetical protein
MNRFAADRFVYWAVAAGCGAVAGCLYLAVLVGSTGGLLLVYLTQLPLFVAGLWLGTTGAAIAGLAATLVLFAASDMLAAALFAALNAVPVAILVRQALLARRQRDGSIRWYPPGLLVAWLTTMALSGIGVALIVMGGPENLQAELRNVVATTLDRLAEPSAIPDRAALADAVALVVPGVVAASWMVMTVINGVLAQGLVARFSANWRPSPELVRLALPVWLSIALSVATAASFIAGTPRFLAVNTMIVLLVPFGLAGLAVLHAAARRLSHPTALLIGFYVFAGLFGWPLLAAALLGLFETWLRLRRRLIRPEEPTNG